MNIRNAFLLVLALCFISCSNGNDEIPDPNPTTINYTTSIKTIMSNNCTSCHGIPTSNGAPMSLTTYTEVKDAVTSRGLINRINSNSNPMPPAVIMTSNNRTLIHRWKDDGFLE